MSVCVDIITKEKLTPDAVFDLFVNDGQQIMVTSEDFPTLKFGPMGIAIRGIEVSEEENGYEIRICTFSSKEDYRLFVRAIELISSASKGKVYDEDDEDITDRITEVFNSDWIEQQRESSLNVVRAMVNSFGDPVIMYGLFCQFCIGPHLLNGFNISLRGDCEKQALDSLERYLKNIQWSLKDASDTSTRMVLTDPSDKDSRGKSITMIALANNKVSDFDYISYADLLVLFDADKKENTLVPINELWKILPKGKFRVIDEIQQRRIADLTADDFHFMVGRAARFQGADIFQKPIFPGAGTQEGQNTVILMWNPDISSVTLDDHNDSIPNMLIEDFNWSVWEHDKAKIGDKFFLVRCGSGNTGIVMSGVFDSQPYEGNDWSGKGRQTFYMDMVPNLILNPDKAPMITTEELEEAIPSFKWDGGHSGRLLNEGEAQIMENLWAEFLKKNVDNADGKIMNYRQSFS